MAAASTLLQVMIAATRKAGRRLKRDFGEVGELQVSRKGPSDFVTSADIKTEQTLYEELAKARPGYGFLGEERGMVEGTDKTHTWIVDPIDGTTNFMHGLPQFAVNVALERESAGVVAAVTYNPITDEVFWAEKGKGAWLGDQKRLRVGGRRQLADCLVATAIPFQGKPGHGQFLKELHQMSSRVAGIRRFGSAALDLAFVAAGRFDGYWERDLKPWDVAAGVLILTEAGGKITDITGGPFDIRQPKILLAASLDLHPLLMERLAAAGEPAAAA